MSNWWKTFYNWLGTDQSANLAQWAGGLGTTGALILGLSLFAQQRKHEARQNALQVMGWVEADDPRYYKELASPDLLSKYVVTVTNNSPVNIAQPEFVILPNLLLSKDEFGSNVKLGNTLKQGSTIAVTFNFPSNYKLLPPRYYVSFRDIYGYLWVRNMKSGKLLSHRKIRRLKVWNEWVRMRMDTLQNLYVVSEEEAEPRQMTRPPGL